MFQPTQTHQNAWILGFTQHFWVGKFHPEFLPIFIGSLGGFGFSIIQPGSPHTGGASHTISSWLGLMASWGSIPEWRHPPGRWTLKCLVSDRLSSWTTTTTPFISPFMEEHIPGLGDEIDHSRRFYLTAGNVTSWDPILQVTGKGPTTYKFTTWHKCPKRSKDHFHSLLEKTIIFMDL